MTDQEIKDVIKKCNELNSKAESMLERFMEKVDKARVGNEDLFDKFGDVLNTFTDCIKSEIDIVRFDIDNIYKLLGTYRPTAGRN